MRRSIAILLTTATATGMLLVPTAAFAGTHVSRAGNTKQAGNAQSGSDPDTTVTFTVTSGELFISVPDSVDLGDGAAGTGISGALGTVTVTDSRALLTASWTVTASSSNFTTGAGMPAETIPATDITYTPGAITKTGTITASGTTITMTHGSQTVVTGANGVGSNTATWDPTISIALPNSAVAGQYTGTISHSVF